MTTMPDPLAACTDERHLASRLSGCMLIDGELVGAASGQSFPVENPATRAVIAHAPSAGPGDVDRAVDAASAAQKGWAKQHARDRGRLALACAEALRHHVEELARLVALETGKAIRTESRLEAAAVADAFAFYGGLASELKGETIPFRSDMMTLTLREPVGVVAAVIPWNVPMMLMAMKIAPAIVAGNAVVVKSAEEAPLAVLRICEIIAPILPRGVINIVSGDGPTCGAALVAHPKVKKVTFTGSVETGRAIYRSAAEKLIPVTLELGGKSPMIVMADADLDRAVAGAIAGMRFTRQGQSCTAASRMLVHADIHDRFVDALVEAVGRLRMGDPLDEATDIGTIISPEQFSKVEAYIRLGETLGGTAHRAAALPEDSGLDGGLFLQPVIFTGLSHDSALAQEEIFGPVTCIFAFEDYEEAIRLANDTAFGLGATIWTRDMTVALDAVHRLEAGFVQVNQNIVAQPNLSYGGVKHSGLGKESSLESMLEHFTHKKTVIFNLAA